MRGRSGVLLSILVASASIVGCDPPPPPPKPAKPAPVVEGPTDSDAPKEFTTTESGLKYRILRKSDGTKPTPKQMATFNYRAKLEDDTIFETTYGTGGSPAVYELAKMTPGLREGIQLIGEGGMIELQVPSKLGYGEYRYGLVPPNASLYYLVELIKTDDIPPPPPDVASGRSAAEGIDETGALPPGPVDPDAPEDFTATASGLKYRIRRKSNGKKPTAQNTVKAHYRGWLDNGKAFDSSYVKRAPIDFPLGQVVKGWTEGLQLIGEGGMIELEIPSELGYGSEGRPPMIPPNSTLHFIIELLEVK